MARLPIHNTAASTAASAKSWLQSLDLSKAETSVPTATLVMWLEAVIAQAYPPKTEELQQSAVRSVMGRFTQLSTAAEEAQDEWAKQGEAEASAVGS